MSFEVASCMSGDLPRSCSTLADVLRMRAATRGNDTVFQFLTDGEIDGSTEVWSFAELERRALGIAAWLDDHAMAGQRALLLYPAGLPFIAGFFGCLLAGVTAVPTYPPDPVRLGRTLPRLRAIARDAEPRAVLTTNVLLAASGALSSELPEFSGLSWAATDSLPEAPTDRWQSRAPVAASALAFLQYTSGSTGAPRGVMVSHANLLNNLQAIQQLLELSEQSRCIS